MASASSTSISTISTELPLVVVGYCLNIHTLIGIMIWSLTSEGIQITYLYTGIYTQLCAHKHNSPLDANDFIIFIMYFVLYFFPPVHSNQFFGRPRRGLLHHWLYAGQIILYVYLLCAQERASVWMNIRAWGTHAMYGRRWHSVGGDSLSVFGLMFFISQTRSPSRNAFCVYVQLPMMRIMCRHCRRQHYCCGLPAWRRRCSTNSV